MRSKSPLALMEQVVMVLVFALAAALCLRVFVFSDQASGKNEAVDRAVLECQNAAETLKAAGGDVAHAQEMAAIEIGGSCSQGLWQVLYDEDWNITADSEQSAYRLESQGVSSAVDGLCRTRVWCTEEKSGEELFSLNVAWQEVSGNG